MGLSKEEIFSEALHLPPSMEKAKLIEALFSSFNYKGRKEIDELWAKEAEERIDAYDAGKITARPINEVFKEINER